MFGVNKNIKEFVKYFIVGGCSFLVDTAVLILFNEFIFINKFLFLSVALAYIAGMSFNFIFASFWVFESGKEKIHKEFWKSYLITFVISAIGLGLTELFMQMFVNILSTHYIIAKIITAAIVLFWNYLARKKWIYG